MVLLGSRESLEGVGDVGGRDDSILDGQLVDDIGLVFVFLAAQRSGQSMVLMLFLELGAVFLEGVELVDVVLDHIISIKGCF